MLRPPLVCAGWKANLLALLVTIPLALIVLATRSDVAAARWVALASVLCAVPWIMAAFTAVAVVSALLYMALHRFGAPPDLAAWLAGDILVAAVIGCHINTALLIAAALHARHRPRADGLGEFLRRSRGGNGASSA